MGESETHSAARPALGYLYQTYWPLLELARRAGSEPELTVALELLDDVQFGQGQALELIQTKHHVNSSGDLGDSGPDLWRTINVWISALERLGPDESPALTLVTTTTASEGSASAYLRPGPDRDPGRSLHRLETAARTSTNQQTATARRRFLGMSDDQRSAFVEAITVADGELAIGQLDDELRRLLFWALPPDDDRAAHFIDQLKGRWHGIAIRLLMRELDAFRATEMLRLVQDVRDQFGPENLPTDPDLPNPHEITLSAFHDRVFVQQLHLIAATQRQLAVAIQDYARAFIQRSSWVRRELIHVGELTEFERKLVDEWRVVFANMTAEVEDATEEEKRRSGRELMAALASNAQTRIRERYEERFMTHGSLHQLADERQIGWHPEFEARLEALLGPVVEGT